VGNWLFVAATLTVGGISNALFALARARRPSGRTRERPLPDEPRREAGAHGPAAVVSVGGTTPRNRPRAYPRR
jgi:hypothetical protein